MTSSTDTSAIGQNLPGHVCVEERTASAQMVCVVIGPTRNLQSRGIIFSLDGGPRTVGQQRFCSPTRAAICQVSTAPLLANAARVREACSRGTLQGSFQKRKLPAAPPQGIIPSPEPEIQPFYSQLDFALSRVQMNFPSPLLAFHLKAPPPLKLIVLEVENPPLPPLPKTHQNSIVYLPKDDAMIRSIAAEHEKLDTIKVHSRASPLRIVCSKSELPSLKPPPPRPLQPLQPSRKPEWSFVSPLSSRGGVDTCFAHWRIFAGNAIRHIRMQNLQFPFQKYNFPQLKLPLLDNKDPWIRGDSPQMGHSILPNQMQTSHITHIHFALLVSDHHLGRHNTSTILEASDHDLDLKTFNNL
ncbi:hypothetical protein PR048_013624 [Dryococelus australis]|uniref:Uncharacterized protein n=1 Tax=Dryococelus australis TaxID=614101 RepID=A0ABQ9HTJ1_9NEOP|nr:hypothetical protein PR048_013624 [Dryococelus australis]